LLLRVERPDRLRRPPEGRIVLVDPHVGEHADDRPLGDRCELGLDQRSDLGLCLGDREIERQRGDLVGGALLTHELVSHLRSVPMGDDERAVGEKRPKGLTGRAQVGALLGSRAALAWPDQRVAAQRYDCGHTSAVSMMPRSARISASPGSSSSCRR
jgi:hypothetical protein